MHQEILPGPERRRRWTDEQKLSNLREAVRGYLSVADVACRYDITCQHIYQWRSAQWRGRWMTRRGASYREAGADVLLLSPRTPEEARHVGDCLGGLLMLLLPPVGLAHFDMTPADMHGLGYRILVVPTTPLLAAYEAVRGVYAELADGFAIQNRPADDWTALQDDLHETIDLERLLQIERNTVEPAP